MASVDEGSEEKQTHERVYQLKGGNTVFEEQLRKISVLRNLKETNFRKEKYS